MISLLIKRFFLLAGVLILAGCAASDFSAARILRPAVDTPEVFMVGSLADASLEKPTAATGCRSPMVDPRDGTRLILRRSAGDRGDYAVPEGSYGVGRGEWLRIDCATGRALGIVKA